MATDTSLTLADAAAQLAASPADVTSALDDAVRRAAQPSANECTLPGPVVQVSFECGGRVVVARRASENSRDWRFEILR